MQVFANSSAQAGNGKQWPYCPHCGTKLAKTALRPFERQRCPRCGTVNHLNPAPGITMLIRSPSQLILIGKRGPTARYGGQWCLPGGYIEYEESFIDTAFREIHEETGLQVRVQGVVNVVSNQLDDWHHTLVIVLIGDVVAGEPRAGDDLVELRWVDKAERLKALDGRGMAQGFIRLAIDEALKKQEQAAKRLLKKEEK